MSNIVQIVNGPNRYANGCVVSNSTTLAATEVIIDVGQVRDITNNFDITVNAPITVSTAFNGANGLDTGTVAADTFYAVYVLYDPTGFNQPAGLISAVSKNPVIPSVNGVTFSTYRLLGYMKTNGSAAILGFTSVGSGVDRMYFWDEPIQELVAGNSAYPTFAQRYLPDSVPNILGTSDVANPDISVIFSVGITPGAPGNILYLDNAKDLSSVLGSEISGSVLGVLQKGQLQLTANFAPIGSYSFRYSTDGTSLADVSTVAFSYSI